MTIIKRDGAVVAFDANKIISAINKAFVEVDGTVFENDTATDIAFDIGKKVSHSQTTTSVEQVQDWVEEYLMKSERPDVARAYIRYRYKKEVARNFGDDFIKAIVQKLDATNVQNQNANIDEHSFGGRTGEASSLMTKRLALEYIVSEKARKNHENNEIYIHDLDAYYVGSHNCLSVPFDMLLAKGFNTRQTDVRPAGSVNTAFQLVAVIFQLQSLQQFGGVSATHLDWTMVPYVRKSFYKHFNDSIKYLYENIDMSKYDYDNNFSIEDNFYKSFPKAYQFAHDMLKKEVYQAAEGLLHNLNTLQSRSGE